MTARTRRCAFLASSTLAAILAALAAPQPAFAQAQTYVFDIPSQDLASALRAFGQQARQQVVFNGAEVRGKTSAAVTGGFSADAALRKLLDGTGLTAGRTPAGAITVRRNSAETISDAPMRDRSHVSEVVVTGTLIRGKAPVGSNLQVYGAGDIASSGGATMQDFLSTLPQNFSPPMFDQSMTGNNARGMGVNLRGLGVGTTLTLVDGRRQNSTGDHPFFDVTSLPAAAVERGEVLTDGASALYGSDAVGGVVNFILRKDLDGGEASVLYSAIDGSDELRASALLGRSLSGGSVMAGYQYYRRTPLAAFDRSRLRNLDRRTAGGADFRVIGGNPGTIIVDGQTYAIPAGQDGRTLEAGQLVPGTANYTNPFEWQDLLPDNETHDIFASGRWRLGASVEMDANVRFNRRETASRNADFPFTFTVMPSSPYYVNPTGGTGPIAVAYDLRPDIGGSWNRVKAETWHADVGLKADLPAGWTLSSFASHGRRAEDVHVSIPDFGRLIGAALSDDPARALNPFGEGSNSPSRALEGGRVVENIPTRSQVSQVNAVLDGAVLSLPAGEVRMALGADLTKMRLVSRRDQAARLTRDVGALFGELAVPLLADGTGRRILELSIAGRFDDYSDVGADLNPKLGLRFAPLRDLAFRGSWGTSYRAPNLIDLHSGALGTFDGILSLPSAPPRQTETVLYRYGSNPEVDPERATTWSLGFDFSPQAIPSLHFGATYYSIDYSNKILVPGDGGLLEQESLWRPFVIRDPERIAALCAELGLGGCDEADAIVDQRVANVSAVRTSGVDIAAAFRQTLGEAHLRLALNANYVFSYDLKLTELSPAENRIDTLGYPSDLRVRATAAYERGPWTLHAAVNYTDDYRDSALANARVIEAWATLDAGVVWRSGAVSGATRGLEGRLQVLNLLDDAPPFVNTISGADPFNSNFLGRVVQVQLTKTW